MFTSCIIFQQQDQMLPNIGFNNNKEIYQNNIYKQLIDNSINDYLINSISYSQQNQNTIQNYNFLNPQNNNMLNTNIIQPIKQTNYGSNPLYIS